MDKTGQNAAERLRHYGTKGEQHLTRVLLSHRLALDGLRFDDERSPRVSDIVRASFDSIDPAALDVKLRRGLHELHLTALKSEFELYLNRVLTVFWSAHFVSLAGNTSKREIPLREVADATLQGISGQDLIVEKMVPNHGLRAFVDALKVATGIKLPKDLPNYDFALWSQIQVAFQVRHIIEHRDGKIDGDFLANVRTFWGHSSWSERNAPITARDRITVEESDVTCTHKAMHKAVSILTNLLAKASSDIAKASPAAQASEASLRRETDD